jgi:hypothetical protein
VWNCLFNAGEATYKWECVGGNPKRVQVLTQEFTTSTTYVNLATDGPSFTSPRAGVYNIHFGSFILSADQGYYALASAGAIGAGSTAPNDTWSLQLYYAAAGGTAIDMSTSGFIDGIVVATAGDPIKMQYRSGFGHSLGFQNRWIAVMPSRLI